MYSFPNTGGRDVSITALVVDMTTVGKPVHVKHRLAVSEANTRIKDPDISVTILYEVFTVGL